MESVVVADNTSLHESLFPASLEEGEGGHLLAHILRFGRLLRLMGVKVNLSQMIELVHALDVVQITHKQDFYHAARALLVSRREDLVLFDQAFALYWRSPEPVADVGQQKQRGKQRRARLPGVPLGDDIALALQELEQTEREARPSYNTMERLRDKNFAEMTWEEVELAKQAISKLVWQIQPRPTRRTYGAKRGSQLDLRKVARDNLRFGGEPLLLRWRKRKVRPRPLVILCDISGSMERYTRLLLHFLHAVSHYVGRIETFVFGTRLTRITHHLRHKDVDEALDEVGQVVRDWSGGTKIGEAIRTFNYHWARRVLGRGAVVLIISDGWDRGDTSTLGKEMARLQRSAHRLIWLNPLLGSENYQPIQRGMSAALPFVDDFLPVHNLRSLEQLADALSSLGQYRPERKQYIHRAITQDA